MQMHANSHDTDGPALLYHLLWQYTDPAYSVICDQQLGLNNLSNKLNDIKFDMDKFCNYVAETLKMLRNAGGDDKQVALKLYEALVTTKNNSFNSEIQAYKAAIAAKDQTLPFSKLINVAKTEYKSMLIRNTWQDRKLSSSHKHHISNIVALKAELKKRDKIIKSYCKSLTSVTSLKHNDKPCPTQGKTNHTSHNYTADAQVGPGKKFLNKA
eukprot:10871068-Ditylum_brightwellii.AAC.1